MPAPTAVRPRRRPRLTMAIPPPGDIAHLITLSVAPAFLLAGIGAMLNVLTQRLARIVDRVRSLESGFPAFGGTERRVAHQELRALSNRLRLANLSVAACTASALIVCLVIVALFVTAFGGYGFGRTVAALFVLAMAALIVGLLLFLLEVRTASRSLRVRPELLRREFLDD